jgi:hypothetical protein
MPCHDVSAFPFKSRKKALREESFVVCVISVRSGEQPDKTYLIRRRPAKGTGLCVLIGPSTALPLL